MSRSLDPYERTDNRNLGDYMRYLWNVPLTVVENLMAEGLCDPEDSINSSPTFGEMMDFMRKYPVFTAHGYEQNGKLYVEGLNFDGEVTVQMIADFYEVFEGADDLHIKVDSLYCWWD